MREAKRAAAGLAMNRWRTATAQTHAPQDYKPVIPSHGQLQEILQAPQGDTGQHRLPQIQESQDEPPQPVPRRSALLSVMDRWRSVAANRQPQHHDDEQPDHEMDGGNPPAQMRIQEQNIPKNKVSEQSTKKDRYVVPAQRLAPAADVGPAKTKPDTQPQEELQTSPEEVIEEEAPKQSPEKRTPQNHRTEKDDAAAKAKYERLLNRAARAREIYLASRVFNHWADRTARRLEREAVARRHMIRFRCFRGWSQAPNSRSPAVDQLRATTAVQKLQRAVADQEEQLRVAAAAIAQEFRLKALLRVFDRWLCHFTQHIARQKAATRTKAQTISNWMLRVSSDNARGDEAVAQTRRRDEANALQKWDDQAQKLATRSKAAQQIGASHLSMAYLRGWWDQAELERRAEAYRAYILSGKTTLAFDQWNLKARAQAFTWRNDFVSVTRVFDTWLRQAQDASRKRDEASRIFVERSQTKFLEHMSRANRDGSTMSHLQTRARLYIGATRLLDVFDGAVRTRKEREWDMVRRQLKMRYQQASSDRKKRNFFTALGRWRSSTAQGANNAQLAERSRTTHDERRQMSTLSKWQRDSDETQHRQSVAHFHLVQRRLSSWRAFSDLHDQSDMQAWGVWAVGKQRQCLKEWSIASLQQGGHAHTASKLRQRHERERRTRTLEQWRHDSDGSRDGEYEAEPAFALQSGPPGSYRSSWGALSTRRAPPRSLRDSQDYRSSLLETPTRSTGIQLSMNSTMPSRPMPPLREADEESGAAASNRGSVNFLESPSRRNAATFSATGLPSTTPRAPVPAYLEEHLPSESTRTQPGQSTNVRSVRIRRPTPSSAPVESSASTPAVRRPYLSQGAVPRRSTSQLSAPASPSKPAGVQLNASQSTKPELFAPIAKSRSLAAPSFGPQYPPNRASALGAEAMAANRRARSPAATQLSPERMPRRPPPSQSLPGGRWARPEQAGQ